MGPQNESNGINGAQIGEASAQWFQWYQNVRFLDSASGVHFGDLVSSAKFLGMAAPFF